MILSQRGKFTFGVVVWGWGGAGGGALRRQVCLVNGCYPLRTSKMVGDNIDIYIYIMEINCCKSELIDKI